MSVIEPDESTDRLLHESTDRLPPTPVSLEQIYRLLPPANKALTIAFFLFLIEERIRRRVGSSWIIFSVRPNLSNT